MEQIRRILCISRRGGEHGAAVTQAEALGRGLGAHVSFLTVAPGDPPAAVVRRAAAAGEDLVVVGAAAFGTRASEVAAALLRHGPLAVLVARPSPSTGKVLVASDLLDPTYPAVATAAEEARRRQARLLVVHDVDTRISGFVWSLLASLAELFSDRALSEQAAAARRRMADALAQHGATGETVVAHGAPAAAVLRLASTLPAELVVLGAPREASLKTLLFGSVIETVAQWAPCSVLVVPTGSETGRTRPADGERTLEREAGAAEGALVEESPDERHAVGDAPRR